MCMVEVSILKKHSFDYDKIQFRILQKQTEMIQILLDNTDIISWVIYLNEMKSTDFSLIGTKFCRHII